MTRTFLVLALRAGFLPREFSPGISDNKKANLVSLGELLRAPALRPSGCRFATLKFAPSKLVELPTAWFVARYSSQQGYGRKLFIIAYYYYCS